MSDGYQITKYGAVAGATALGMLLLWAARSSNQPKADDVELDDKLQNNTFLAATLVKDLTKVGVKISVKDVRTLLQFVFIAGSGRPVDDRELMTEKLMAIVAKLPESSRARKRLTDILIKGLWDGLDHPPMSFHGPQYQYRTADGSYNNVLIPDLGKAGQPYAKSIMPKQPMQTQRPDPEILFDSLMARQPGKYRENEAGLSVMLFYHATIIIHDVFRSNRYNPNISDTSSYVDLAPLYGSSVADQAQVRAFQGGLLKPDTFFEERLLAQPAGVNVMLVLYSRFHNYCADVLLKINEGGKFTLKPGDRDQALKSQDEDLFQTARLITGGLYANIALHDYLRGLTNTHHSDSSWTMDPRGSINKGSPIKSEVARGLGNQVSTEFNLMYRFHSAVSLKDEAWIEKFYREELGIPDAKEASYRDVLLGLQKYENTIKKDLPDPSQRVFGGLKRGKDGKFSDQDLVNVLQSSIEDPAGAFGANHVPQALKAVEMLGIMRAREWQTASLNEFREFFGLKRHESFEDINPDPGVADLLRTLYDTPDMVEGYPGMWIEDSKPAMNTGSGVCLPYTVGRAIFSDAITLVRSDRFYTLDFTPATLTSWGLAEVSADYETLGGSVYYKLIQRGLPGWFPFNSLHIMQPFYTRKTNEKIAREIGTIDDYTFDGPKPPVVPKVEARYRAVRQILGDRDNFAPPILKGFTEMGDGRDHSGFMLMGNEPRHISQRRLVDKLVFCSPDFLPLVFDTSFSLADEALRTNTAYCGKIRGKDRFQLDVIKEVAIPTLTQVLAGIFCLDLKTEENPEGSYDIPTLYHDLLTAWTWIFSNLDSARAWNRRREARKACARLRATTLAYLERHIPNLPDSTLKNLGLWDRIKQLFKGPRFHVSRITEGTIRWYGLQVAIKTIAAVGDVAQAADLLSTVVIGGGGLPIGNFAESYNYLLDVKAQAQYKELSTLALNNSKDSDRRIEAYMYESFRLSNDLKIFRVAKTNVTVKGVTYKPGDVVCMPVGKSGASSDPEGFPDPKTFNSNRPKDSYINHGDGQHMCFGKSISNEFVCAMLKATAGLQEVQLNKGAFDRVNVGGQDYYISADGSDLERHPSSAKLTFSAYTRTASKSQAPIYTISPAANPGPKLITEMRNTDLIVPTVDKSSIRPQDIGAEMLHVDEGKLSGTDGATENGDGDEDGDVDGEENFDNGIEWGLREGRQEYSHLSFYATERTTTTTTTTETSFE